MSSGRCHLILLLSLVMTACGAKSHPQVGGETNWLARCSVDAECGQGSCLCGMCTNACESASDCGEADAICESAAIEGGGMACAARLCLPRCASDGECGDGFVCAGGACLPQVRPATDSGSPASSSDAGSDPVGSPIALGVVSISGEPQGTIGYANAIVGDLDVDGYDDFVVLDYGGAGPMAERYGVRGAAYLFYGRPALAASFTVLEADAILRGASEIVHPLGDVDADGLPDFAFGSKEGVHVVFGSRERLSGEHFACDIGALLTVDDVSDVADGGSHSFVVNRAGDVNGDGHDDLFVQVRDERANPQIVDTFLLDGRAIVRMARVNLATTAQRLEDASAFDIGGGGAGDVDGDGYHDLLLMLEDGQTPNVGLFYGSSAMLEAPLRATDAAATWDDGLWVTLGGAGDLDGDGLGDFAVGGHDSVSIVYGSPARLHGVQPIDSGSVVILAEGKPSYLAGLGFGDVDGDGWVDVLVGDPHQARNGYQSGALYALLGAGRIEGSQRLGEHYALAYGNGDDTSEDRGEALGYGTASGGDVNGDGFDDVVVGAPGHVVGDEHGGISYLLFGASSVRPSTVE